MPIKNTKNISPSKKRQILHFLVQFRRTQKENEIDSKGLMKKKKRIHQILSSQLILVIHSFLYPSTNITPLSEQKKFFCLFRFTI